MVIEEVNAEDTLPLRSAVLREGAALHKCRFEGDENTSSIHLGIRNDGELVAIASLISIAEHNMQMDADPADILQLRGMAVDAGERGKGLGGKLVQAAENRAKSKGFKAVFCNARERAVSLYLKNGFTFVGFNEVKAGEGFLIPGIGIHYKMIKWI